MGHQGSPVSLLSMSVRLCFTSIFKIPHIRDIIWCLSFSDFIFIIISRSIHAAADGIISFFVWLSNIPLYVCICACRIIFLHSSLYGRWRCFHVSANIVLLGAMRCVSFQRRVLTFSGYMPKNGTYIPYMCPTYIPHTVALVLVLKESPHCFPYWLHQFVFPPTVQDASLLFSTASLAFIFL